MRSGVILCTRVFESQYVRVGRVASVVFSVDSIHFEATAIVSGLTGKITSARAFRPIGPLYELGLGLIELARMGLDGRADHRCGCSTS